MSFFNFTEAELIESAPIIFPAKEVVEFACLNFNETRRGDLMLNCKVLTGAYAGRDFTPVIDNREHPVSRKNKINFARAFWSEDELRSNTAQPARLINRRFSAVPLEAREHNGKQYQSFIGWKDLGEMANGSSPDALPADSSRF